MAEYNNTNTFTLNKNDKGENLRRPDYRGKLNIDGIEFTLSGWIREGANGKFISGAVAMVATDERLKPAVEGAEEDGKYVGLIEIKCPIETTHTNTLMSKSVPSKYIPQIQWQMASVSPNVKWVDFISYNPNFPDTMQLFIARVDRDDTYIAELEAEVVKFLDEVEQTILKLKE